MLALRELPERQHLESLQREFPEADIPRVQAYLGMLKTCTDVVRRIDTYLAGHGLQQNRFFILVLLYRSPGVPLAVHRLAAGVGVSRPTVTGLLDGLERQQWVEREPDPGDGRGVLVRITEAGIAYLHGVMPGYFALVNRLFAELGEADYRQLLELLGKIRL